MPLKIESSYLDDFVDPVDVFQSLSQFVREERTTAMP